MLYDCTYIEYRYLAHQVDYGYDKCYPWMGKHYFCTQACGFDLSVKLHIQYNMTHYNISE